MKHYCFPWSCERVLPFGLNYLSKMNIKVFTLRHETAATSTLGPYCLAMPFKNVTGKCK